MKKLAVGVCAAVAAVAVANAALVNHWSFDDTEHPFRDSVTGTDGVVVKCTSKGNYEEADATTVAATLTLSDEKAYDGLKKNSGAIDLMQYVGFKALHGIDNTAKKPWCAVIRFFNETTTGFRAIYSIDPPAGWSDGHLFLKNGDIGIYSYTPANVTEQKWYTLIISFDVAGNATKFFLNGATRVVEATGKEDLRDKSCFIFGLDDWGEDKSLYWDDIKIYDEAYPEEYFSKDAQGMATLRAATTEVVFDIASAASSVLPVRAETESGVEVAFVEDGTLTLKGQTVVTRTDYDARGGLMNVTELGTLEPGATIEVALGKAAKSVYTLARLNDAPTASGSATEVGAKFAKFRCSLDFLGGGAESADLYLGVGPKGGDLAYHLVGAGYTDLAETDFTLTGLSPETDYDFTLKVTNDKGDSGESARQSFRTLSAPSSGGIAFSSGEPRFSFDDTTPVVLIPCDVSYAGAGADTVRVVLRYGRSADDLSESLTLAESCIGRNEFVASGFELHQTYFMQLVVDNGAVQAEGEVFSIETRSRWTCPDATSITDGNWVFRVKTSGNEIELLSVRPETRPGLKVCDLFASVTDGEGNALSIVRIGGDLFNGNACLEMVYLPESLREIASSAFRNCSKLRVVEPFLPDSVTVLGSSAFRDSHMLCGDLRLGFGGRDVTLGANAFDMDDSAGSITSATFGPGVKALPYSFLYWQTELTNVTFVGNSIVSLDRSVFAYCTKLKTVTPFLPSSLQSINSPDGEKYNGVFIGCTALVGDLVLGGGSEDLRIGRDSFKTASSVSTVQVKKNVTYLGTNALSRLTARAVSFEARPEFVKGDGVGTFAGCSEYARFTVRYRFWKDIVDDPAYVTPWAQVDEEERAKFAVDYPGEKHPYGLTTAALFGQKEWLFVDRPGLVLIVR